MIFLFVVLSMISISAADQDTINYLASNIQIEYYVIDNLVPGPFQGQLVFTNTGEEAVLSLDWSLYFCSDKLFEPDNIDPDGADLGTTGLRVYRMNGCMQKIEPSATFPGFTPGSRLEIPFLASADHIAVSETYPNWYFADLDSEPRVCTSNNGEDISWIGAFNTSNQWKRNTDDTYDPYTGPVRLAMQNYTDLGQAASRILPTPIEENLDPSSFVDIGTGEWLVVADQNLQSEGNFLADALGVLLIDPEFTPSSHYISLNLSEVIDGGGNTITEAEAYRVDVLVTEQVIEITGVDTDGVFNAIQTLLALYAGSSEIPGGYVVDYPRYHYRGMHVDVSRNFHDKDRIMSVIEVMAMYKLNKFHFHLTDDEGWRLEIPGLPELTQIGARRCHDLAEEVCLLPQRGSGPGLTNTGTGYYSVDDYREILNYANTRHIQVIPEFDIPGHSDAAIKSMLARYRAFVDTNITAATEFLLSDLNDESSYRSVQNFANNSINPCMSSTYKFIGHVIREVKALHQDIQPLTTFNFGGDEVPGGAWQLSPECSPISNDRHVLMEYFVRNVATLTDAEGLDLSGWADGFLDAGGVPYNVSSLPSPNNFAYVWNSLFQDGRGDRPHIMANAGFKTIYSPATHFYFDMPYEPDPYDRGAYWATRLTSNIKIFSFMPDSLFENMGVDGMGRPIDKDQICETHGCTPLEPGKEDNIIGLQGQLWSETTRTKGQLDYMIFPRVITLSERAWHKALWEDIPEPEDRDVQRMADFERFVNTMGYRELGRLEQMGVEFCINPPGAEIAEFNRLEALSEFPGLPIQYSTDGGQTWADYTGSQTIQPGTVHVVTRSPDGSRVSRMVELTVI